jgi:hypothetical protein
MLTVTICLTFVCSASTLFFWMEAVSAINGSLNLKITTASPLMKQLLMAFGFIIVTLDVCGSVLDVYGAAGAASTVTSIVYSICALTIAGVSIYTCRRIQSAINKIYVATGVNEVTGNSHPKQKEMNSASITAVVTPMKHPDCKGGGGSKVVVTYTNGAGTMWGGTSLSSSNAQKSGLFHKSRASGKMLLSVADKLKIIVHHVYGSVVLLLLLVMSSLLIAMNVQYTGPDAFGVVMSFPLFVETALSLSDLVVISSAIDSSKVDLK